MTLFIYEHLTSGALSSEPSSLSLMHEGDAMLQAISSDLLALGHHIAVMRDARLNNDVLSHPKLTQFEVDSVSGYQQVWQHAIKTYQLFLVIAPETDGVLANVVKQLEQQGKTVLGCNSASIDLFSDKLRCSIHLQQYDIASPVSYLAKDWLTQPHNADAVWVTKPRDGAGCETTYRLNTSNTHTKLSTLMTEHAQEFIVQPYIEGQHLSLSLFIDDDDIALLSVNIQHIDMTQQQLKLSHCEPQRQDQLATTHALKLAHSIHATMPGLWGFVGIDLIKTAHSLWVIDINPRLTSSYAESAMRQQHNPASRLHQNLTHTKTT